MISNIEIEKISKIIADRKKVVVISHINPDGDAIGSGTALTLFLKKAGLQTTHISPNDLPEFLQWLPGAQDILVYNKNKDEAKKQILNAEVIFMLDFNEANRAGGLEKAILESGSYKIMIDHHEDPETFADMLISESWRGSTGEMIYLMLKALDVRHIDHDIATCLYVAIITDTGNFRYGSSYEEIFVIAGELMKYGIDKDAIFSNVYDSYSQDRMRLMGYCMSEKMTVFPEYHMAYISITKEELERFQYKEGDTEGFVNIPFTIKGIKVTGLFIEKKDHVKISLRSKGNFSVNDLAAEHFNGGGHINAAGGESKLSLEETLKKFKKIISLHEQVLKD